MRMATLAALTLLLTARSAFAFCGFYVAKADAQIYNHASQVVIARDGDREILTISNDFKGPLTEFAEVVPVPTVLQRDQVHIGERKLVERIDAYSAPRLVEYFDPDPCQRRMYAPMAAMALSGAVATKGDSGRRELAKSLGVKIEAEYTVGEYDIVILSALQSNGLEQYLKLEGYKIPDKAAAALEPYIKQEMKFFVAKVNLKEQAKTGFTYLRPIQIAFESPKFMLPIRLGMANSEGTQDLTIYTLTRKGRVESTNYRTVELPSGMDVPVYVKDEFKDFYKAVFDRAYDKEERKAVFTEYTWNGASCDPCADPPLSPEELRGLGVFWQDEQPQPAPYFGGPRSGFRGGSAPLVTRLHVRYDAADFPEDLVFQETGNRASYQARYVLRHAWKGGEDCDDARDYRRGLRERHQKEAETLASLTGWDMATIVDKMGDDAPDRSGPVRQFATPPPPQPDQPAPEKTPPAQDEPWYKRFWNW